MDKLELVAKQFDKKTVMKNVRESRLDYMFHRQLITESEFVAGSRYRRLCEISQLGGRASSYEPKLDYGSEVIMDSKIGAFSKLAKISEELLPQFIIILKYFCYQNYSITEISKCMNLTEPPSPPIVPRTTARCHTCNSANGEMINNNGSVGSSNIKSDCLIK